MIKLLGYIITIDECAAYTGIEVLELINTRLAEIASCEGVERVIVDDDGNPHFADSRSNLKFMGIKYKKFASQ